MEESIGLIETMGMIAAIEASDTMLKTANVTLINKEVVKGGLVTVVITGDVGAVKTAVDSAVAAVEHLGNGLLISSHVIPRPDRSIQTLLPDGNDLVKDTFEEFPLEDKVVELQDSIEDKLEVQLLEIPKELSEEDMRTLLKEDQVNIVREYLLNQTVAQLREVAKQHNDFIIERKQLYRTNKADLVEAVIVYLSDKL